MRIKAYILAADPAWIEAGVLSYYDVVEEILVSYDRNGRGWNGSPIAVEECLARLRKIDRDGKMRFCPGDFARLEHHAMENETHQRCVALAALGNGADWILQLDPDEVLPNAQALLAVLQRAGEEGIPAVEWPMRVLFQRLRDGRYLEVCHDDGSPHVEYPGPVAIRPGLQPIHGRQVKGPFMRPGIAGNLSLQLSRPAEPGEYRVELGSLDDAIIHNSWARSATNIRSKIGSWGHNQGWRTKLYYLTRWKPAPYLWQSFRDFHPFVRGLWPRLRPTIIALQHAGAL